jgi:hypothetical protein
VHTAKNVARRIDRLARRAHAFHRFAHHPLCDVYESEVIRLGKRSRLCRGCAYLYGAAAAGTLSGALWWASARPPVGWGTAMLGLGAAWLWLGVERRASRGGGGGGDKALTRAVPGALLGFGFTTALMGSASVWPLAAAIAALLVLVVVVRRYRARGPNRSACLRCPEYSTVSTCRGFAPIVRRERAFMRVAARWMAEPRARPRQTL